LSRRGEKVLAIVATAVAAAGIGLAVWIKASNPLSPLVGQAKRLGATYENARAGQPVLWCVDHYRIGDSFAGSRRSWPLRWTNEGAVPMTHEPKGGHCEYMLARVVERAPDGVVLEYLGRP
jgi:hypothetical protein